MKPVRTILRIAVLLCYAAGARSGGTSASHPHCRKTRLFKKHGVPVWSSAGPHPAIFYQAGLAVDADGAYRAYHPEDGRGLDSLSHAGHPGNWWALVTDNGKRSGRPVLQGAGDPAPGFYVSTTALYDPDNPNVRDPHRYVDAEEIPYVVLHPAALRFARLGDFATVANLQNGRMAAAIVADESAPNLPVGEGSIALAKALGVDADPRVGGKDADIAYIVYPGSGNRRPRELREIEANSKRLFEAWGGAERLKACLAE
jgi:hypothetical protein